MNGPKPIAPSAALSAPEYQATTSVAPSSPRPNTSMRLGTPNQQQRGSDHHEQRQARVMKVQPQPGRRYRQNSGRKERRCRASDQEPPDGARSCRLPGQLGGELQRRARKPEPGD